MEEEVWKIGFIFLIIALILSLVFGGKFSERATGKVVDTTCVDTDDGINYYMKVKQIRYLRL